MILLYLLYGMERQKVSWKNIAILTLYTDSLCLPLTLRKPQIFSKSFVLPSVILYIRLGSSCWCVFCFLVCLFCRNDSQLITWLARETLQWNISVLIFLWQVARWVVLSLVQYFMIYWGGLLGDAASKYTSKCFIYTIPVTVHTGIQERGDEDCDKRGI